MSHDHHDHHNMGHDGHDMGAHGASMETTTMHDHAAMVAETTGHNHASPNSGMMMMMQMYFYADYKAVVLFEAWDIQTIGAMVGSCIGIFLMGILYEGLKYFREYLSSKNYSCVTYNNVKGPGEAGSEASSQVRTPMSFKTSVTSASHYIQTALHLVQMIISYLLMLIVMTYNVWLFMAVVLGCTVGYFLFGWRKGFLVDITEHCH